MSSSTKRYFTPRVTLKVEIDFFYIGDSSRLSCFEFTQLLVLSQCSFFPSVCWSGAPAPYPQHRIISRIHSSESRISISDEVLWPSTELQDMSCEQQTCFFYNSSINSTIFTCWQVFLRIPVQHHCLSFETVELQVVVSDKIHSHCLPTHIRRVQRIQKSLWIGVRSLLHDKRKQTVRCP